MLQTLVRMGDRRQLDEYGNMDNMSQANVRIITYSRITVVTLL